MAPFSGSSSPRIRMEGPQLMLWPAAAQSLALVLHELATNAAKYGALSAPDGHVEIRWEVRGDPAMLELDWLESSSVAVTEPQSVGFGSRIISASVERQLQGKVTKQYLGKHPNGYCGLGGTQVSCPLGVGV